MSIKIVHEEIDRFLGNAYPEVLCIKGKWGVGKTYAWNYFFQQAVKEDKLMFDKYAYVSLFGLKTIEEVKYSLFESTVNKKDLNKDPDLGTLISSCKWIKGNLRKSVGLLKDNPLIQSYIGGSERNLFFFVRNQVVCIDDLERSGDGLSVLDVFGLISQLKEQRKCKVVILLNDEKLSEGDKRSYYEQFEKVVDINLDFNPTAQEAADIVFPKPKGIQKLLKKNCIVLGITNIRVIKKIERIALRFEEIFGARNLLIDQIAHAVVLFGWSIYQPNEAPSVNFLGDFTRVYGFLKKDKEIPEKERKWQTLLRSYGYFVVDNEFNLKILETIQNGFFDVGDLKVIAARQLQDTKRSQFEQAFSNAWNLFHDSFKDNENEVLKAIYFAASNYLKFIEPINLDSTVVLLKEFNRNKEAKDLIRRYVELRVGDPSFPDIKRSIFARDMKDVELIGAIEDKLKSLKGLQDSGQVFRRMAVGQGWSPDDILVVSRLTSDELYEIFKKEEGVDLRRLIRLALDLGQTNDASDEMKTFSSNASIALRRISKESKLNKRRVEVYGISDSI